ncbi:MAG: hypothetical protein GXX79_18730 [Actinomycetales bacterium]|nr:hypothetical protein [Actinomycetales bacterium]
MRIATLLVVLWLVIGFVAATQRGYFSGSDTNCAEVGSVVLTVVAGPLNYLGANPRIECDLPQPST